MQQESQDNKERNILTNSVYSSGGYFRDVTRHSEDAKFKANSFLRICLPFIRRNNLTINSLIDVGCGSGDIVKLIVNSLKSEGINLNVVKGYDVSPHVKKLKDELIEYIHGDFCKSNEFVDIVTLFDVFEHVPDPIEFIKLVSKHCKIIVFHIPLEYCFYNSIRNLFVNSLKYSGHLLFMDIASALNILALAGLTSVDYRYSYTFAPSSRKTLLAKLAFPIRYILSKISPYLLSKLVGASLITITITPLGTQDTQLIRHFSCKQLHAEL